MKKWLCACLAMIMVAGLATGCSKDDGKPRNASGASGDATDGSSQSTASVGSVNTDAGLVVYTPLPEQVVAAAVEGFEAKTGIHVQVVQNSADVLAEQIATPKAGQPNADVLFGAGAELVEQYAVYFQSYQTSESSAIVEEFRSENQLWTALTPMPVVLMYSKTQTTKAPDGWATLLGEAYGGWVALADPERSGTSYTALYTMAQAIGKGGAPDYDTVDKFAGNLQGKLLDSIAEVYAGVAAGDFAVGITLESSAQKYLDAGYGEQVGYQFPSEGTMAALEVSAITAKAGDVSAAGAFLDYVSSQEFQQVLAEQLGLRSVRSDVAAPAGYTELSEIKLLDYSPKSAVAGRQEVLDRFGTAYREGKAAATASEADGASSAA